MHGGREVWNPVEVMTPTQEKTTDPGEIERGKALASTFKVELKAIRPPQLVF